jgi:D-alanyl-D-alanine carboxypeptidase/D-alanyl-D-alanine-endopeptidase (penicillin-binding protein 4)
MDPGTGDVLRAHNAGLHFVPASNQKILTTAAALEALGPEHRFRTAIWAVGAHRDGLLEGDLVVRPSGDPTMSRRFHPDSGSAAPLGRLARQVAAAGIRRVEGRLVVDATAWDSTTVEETWMSGDLSFGYAAAGGAFAVDEGVFEVIVGGGDGQEEAQVEVRPRRARWRVHGRPRIVARNDSARIRLDPLRGGRWRLHGTQQALDVDTLSRNAGEPVLEAGRALVEALASEGVAVQGGLQVAWPGDRRWSGCPDGDAPRCEGAREVAAVVSPPLMQVAAAILEPSQNWVAEQVIRVLGSRADEGRPSWTHGLEEAEAVLVEGFGVDSTAIDLRDGSGLSAYNLVTPRAVADILTGIARRPWAAAYREALAEPGELDSTLERRLPALDGRLFAKTGTITHVNSLSGYLVTDGGRTLVFSLLTNVSGLESWRVRRAMDEWVMALASSS